MKPAWPLIDAALVGDSVDTIKAGLIPPLQRALYELRTILSSGATFGDNMNAAIVEIPLCVHGTERVWSNPLKSKPIGFIPMDSTRQLAGYPDFNDAPLDASGNVIAKSFGLTASYEMNHTKECRIKNASATQSIANNSDTAITGWDTVSFSRGTTITDDGSIFTIAEAGTYTASIHCPLEAATYTAYNLYLQIGGSNDNLNMYFPVAFTTGPDLTGACTFRVTAGQTLVARIYQANGAAAARNITTARRIAIHRLYNDTVPSATVTGILVGG